MKKSLGLVLVGGALSVLASSEALAAMTFCNWMSPTKDKVVSVAVYKYFTRSGGIANTATTDEIVGWYNVEWSKCVTVWPGSSTDIVGYFVYNPQTGFASPGRTDWKFCVDHLAGFKRWKSTSCSPGIAGNKWPVYFASTGTYKLDATLSLQYSDLLQTIFAPVLN